MGETSTAVHVSGVRILEGCIICGLCEDTCPQVFSVKEETCLVRGSAEQYYSSHAVQIIQAARECPVDVIKVKGVNE